MVEWATAGVRDMKYSDQKRSEAATESKTILGAKAVKKT